jgi:hypothetical protein
LSSPPRASESGRSGGGAPVSASSPYAQGGGTIAISIFACALDFWAATGKIVQLARSRKPPIFVKSLTFNLTTGTHYKYSFSYIYIFLPDEFQCKLNLPRSGGSSRDLSGTRYGSARLINNGFIVSGGDEIWMIEKIKNLGAKLHIKIFRNPLDWIVLEKRSVEIRKTRAYQGVPAFVSEQVRAVDLAVGRGLGCPRKINALCRK